MIEAYRTASRLAAALLIEIVMLPGCAGYKQPDSIPMSNARRSPATSNQKILLYAGGNKFSYVVPYPGGTLLGKIHRPSFGACSDASGNVYMTGVGSVAEFAYGQTTPFATASVPGTAYSCSVDPTTNDLAVVVFCASGCGDEVAVFTTLNYSPQLYQTSALTQMTFCGYDAGGNLFVDGYDKQQFALAELPTGGSTFSPISVDRSINDPGQVQWDGSYLTIEDTYHPIIYQFAISGSTATTVGSTRLRQIGLRAGQSWIGSGIVAVPMGMLGKRAIQIGIWPYPSGGKRLSLINGFGKNGKQITGLTMSMLPSATKRGN